MKDRVYNGQRFIFAGSFPYIRRDGSATELNRWRSRCPQCGDWFTFTSPSEGWGFNPNRRCQKHKRPGQRVRKL